MNTDIKNRILFFSPSVQAGWQRESHRMDFQIVEKLGEGSFGNVYKVRHKKTKKIYALKQIKKKSIATNKLIEHAQAQIKIMYSLNHPNIIKLYNHFEDEVSIYLILEFAGKGQLMNLLQKSQKGKFDEKKASGFIRQIAQGLSEIHKNRIMHRDIKLENILVSDKEQMKIADFGWSHFQSFQERYTFCGTLDYLAPQMLKKSHRHDYRVDLWSIGVLIYQICSGESPFSSQLVKKKQLTEENVFRNIMNVSYKSPSFFTVQCKDLIEKLLVFEPTQRLEAHQILTHPWIRNNCESKLVPPRQWLDQLKKEVLNIFPDTNISTHQKDDHKAFSKEQIYNYTRPDSVINFKPLKKHFPKTEEKPSDSDSPTKQSTRTNIDNSSGLMVKKLSQLEIKVTMFERQHKKDQEQIERLKEQNRKNRDHHECQAKIRQLMNQMSEQNKQFEILNSKLIDSQIKLLKFEREKNR